MHSVVPKENLRSYSYICGGFELIVTGNALAHDKELSASPDALLHSRNPHGWPALSSLLVPSLLLDALLVIRVTS